MRLTHHFDGDKTRPLEYNCCMHIVIHTDGGSRGNPGPAASAFTVHSPQNETLHEEKKFLGTATNNVAEYSALLMAHEWLAENAKKMDIQKADILMDSELIVKQMTGEYRIKDETLKLLASRVKSLESSLPFSVVYAHVRRAQNARADELVNAAMDEELTHVSSTGN